jgi:hypothetical protein
VVRPPKNQPYRWFKRRAGGAVQAKIFSWWPDQLFILDGYLSFVSSFCHRCRRACRQGCRWSALDVHRSHVTGGLWAL